MLNFSRPAFFFPTNERGERLTDTDGTLEGVVVGSLSGWDLLRSHDVQCFLSLLFCKDQKVVTVGREASLMVERKAM